MVDSETVCPSCSETILLPNGIANLFECPECDAGIDWNGRQVVGLITNRKYRFEKSHNSHDSFFDSEFLPNAVQFADEVMDDDVPIRSVLGYGENSITTVEGIQEDIEFSRRVTLFGGLLMIPALFVAITILPQEDGIIGACCCMAIPGLVLAFGSMQSHSPGDLELAGSEGGAFRHGSGTGITPDGKFLVTYGWRHDVFNFAKFKKIRSEHFIVADTYYSPGGDHSSPSQGYILNYYVGEQNIHMHMQSTRVHNFSRENFKSDLERLLSIKTKIEEGSNCKIDFVIDINLHNKLSVKKTRKTKANLDDLIENDSEISSLWKQLTGD